MSGVEIAGIVLACIPLIFNAIESYQNGKSKLAVWKRYGSLLQTLVRELQSQHVFFEKNLEILLKSAGVENIEVSRFEQNDASSIWLADADEAVKAHLGTSYTAFFQTVLAYRNVAEKVAMRMQESGTSFKTASASIQEMLPAKRKPDGSFEFLKRLRFTLGRSEIQNLIAELQSCNTNLTKFCSDVQRVKELDTAAAVPSRRAGRIAASLTGVRNQAQRLFEAVSAKWSSACHDNHEVSLRLEPRLDKFAVERKSSTRFPQGSDLIFNLGLGHTSSGQGADCQWFDAGVRKIDECIAAISGSSSRTIVRIESCSGDVAEMPEDDARDVVSICTSIALANEGGHSLRFHVSEHNKLMTYLGASAPAPILCSRSEGALSLETLLGNQTRSNQVGRLSLADRMRTAINLSSNLLQLSGTAWLSNQPFKELVLFPRSTSRSVRPVADIGHPFLCQSHSPVQGPQASAREMLLELAIVLMELWHNEAIEDYVGNSGDVDDREFYKRLSLAHRWLDETEQDMVPRHSKAVRSCIRCCVGHSGGLDDVAFRNEVTETVLMPLMENARDISI